MSRNAFAFWSVRRGLLICAFAVSAVSITRAQIKNPIPGDPVAIDTGKVAGTVLDTGVHAYLGIPFAVPPVGDLRWHAPVPVKPWTNVYDASATRPACAQRAQAGGANAEQYSEDCLFVNVWTPPTAKAGAKLPVLVFIYGGGFSGGSPSSPGYA